MPSPSLSPELRPSPGLSPELRPSPGLSPGPVNFYFECKPEPGNEPEPRAEPGIELRIEPEPGVEPGIEPEPGLYLLSAISGSRFLKFWFFYYAGFYFTNIQMATKSTTLNITWNFSGE